MPANWRRQVLVRQLFDFVQLVRIRKVDLPEVCLALKSKIPTSDILEHALRHHPFVLSLRVSRAVDEM